MPLHRAARRAPVAVLLSLAMAAPAAAQRSVNGSFVFEGRKREFTVRIPKTVAATTPLPLVLVLHGGGGDARSMIRLTRFNDLADREQFLAVYPNGLAGNWNDGRGGEDIRAQRDSVDDVGFINALLDSMIARYRVDTLRLYATGISNGGIFSHTLGLSLAKRLAAIAPVAGGIAQPLAADFHPAAPVSVLIIHGTDDPLVPIKGGNVARSGRGEVIPTDSSAALWRAADGITGEGLHELIRGGAGRRACDTQRTIWTGGAGGTAVQLDVVVGGGHAWPGGRQYAPRLLIGKACSPPDATELIWRFFAAHPKA
jgi:polyhydroxybutyrate depolymerase